MKFFHCKTLIIFFLLVGCEAQTNETGFENGFLKADVVIPAGYTYPTEDEFSVLSWNVEHFIDLYDDPYIKNNREDNPDSTMLHRISPFLSALRIADADIVVLQEFESAKFLQQLASDSLSDMGYLYFADAPSHTWYMNVVIMSRFPLGVLSTYGNVTTPVVDYLNEKGEQETQHRINTRMWSMDVFPSIEYHFQVTGLHLKAGRGERNIGMRLGQINFLKSQFARRMSDNPNSNLLIVGDLNATPESEEIITLLDKGPNGNKFVDPLAPTTLTHPSDSVTRRLDYILPNVNMRNELLEVQVKYFFSPDTMRIISDHLPVMARFRRMDQ